MLKGLLAKEFRLETPRIAQILMDMGLSGDIRGEKLSVRDFAALADIIEREMR
jgi:16S rRNA A1518/A1519 N6-dimethyltransferase RsmA/KsgA/DIM1 with predicted DNA glycosylase/AP lyase activity